MSVAASDASGPPSAQITVIRPQSGWADLRLGEVWAYRGLMYFLVWRDVKVRYKQTVLGAAWAVIQPLATMVVFSLIFGRFAGVPSEGVPYPLFAFSGLLAWQLFAHALSESGNSLVGNRDLITKVYFPRLVIPLAAILAGLVDLSLALLVLAGLMVFYGVAPPFAVITFPLFVALALATALAVGLWLSALNVKYRDVRYTIPFLSQLWLFVTPVAYPASLVPDQWRLLFGLNPMTGVVEGFRWALIGAGAPPGPLLAVSVAATATLLLTGMFHFRRMERSFADVV